MENLLKEKITLEEKIVDPEILTLDKVQIQNEKDKEEEGISSEEEKKALHDQDDEFDSADDSENDGAIKHELDPAMMNELLLVCSNLGVTEFNEDKDETKFVRGEDCEEWIHDLQRAIRRDSIKYKLVAQTLGKWKILQKKLIPLVLNHQNDWSLVFSILKVLVMLTMKPPSNSFNQVQQYRYLREHKQAFIRNDLIEFLMSVLIEPMSREGSVKTSKDYLVIEIVLTLIRNLLAIPNEKLNHQTSGNQYLGHLQEDFIILLNELDFIDTLLYLAQDIESSEHKEWNLLLMEMLDLILRISNPEAIINEVKVELTPTKISKSLPSKQTIQTNSLIDKIKQEKKQHPLNLVSSRHGNFGGVVKMKGPGGQALVVTDLNKTSENLLPQAARKGRSKRRGQVKKTIDYVTDPWMIQETTYSKDSQKGKILSHVVRKISDHILENSYTALTNSLKNEFKRGSGRLLPTDRTQYFHLIWFLSKYHRLNMKYQEKKHRNEIKQFEKARDKAFQEQGADVALNMIRPSEWSGFNGKAILCTLDMFSFNFVLQTIEDYVSEKNYDAVLIPVELLSEMMVILHEMGSSTDTRFARIAVSLQHKIFYEREFLDRLPVLIRTWDTVSFPYTYTVNVVTLTHMVLKMLDQLGGIVVLSKRKTMKTKKKKKKEGENEKGDNENESEKEDEEALLNEEVNRKEVRFDARKYFLSLVNHETILLYCHLLSQYQKNTSKVNHYIHSFLYRVQNFKLDAMDHINLEEKKEKFTLEPMLFNIHSLITYKKILTDTHLHCISEMKPLLDFLRNLVRRYFELSKMNPLIFVESLFRLPFPVRSCIAILDRYTKPQSKKTMSSFNENEDIVNRPIFPPRRDHEEDEIEGEAEFDMNSIVENKNQDKISNQVQENEKLYIEDNNNNNKEMELKKKKKLYKSFLTRGKKWSFEEDKVLKDQYKKLRHLPSVFDVLVLETIFQEKSRTSEQLKRRVKHLGLNNLESLNNSSSDSNAHNDDDDDDDDDDKDDSSGLDSSSMEDNVKMRKRLKIKRKKKKADSESEKESNIEKKNVPRLASSFIGRSRTYISDSDSNISNESELHYEQLSEMKSKPKILQMMLSDESDEDIEKDHKVEENDHQIQLDESKIHRDVDIDENDEMFINKEKRKEENEEMNEQRNENDYEEIQEEKIHKNQQDKEEQDESIELVKKNKKDEMQPEHELNKIKEITNCDLIEKKDQPIEYCFMEKDYQKDRLRINKENENNTQKSMNTLEELERIHDMKRKEENNDTIKIKKKVRIDEDKMKED